MRHALPGASLIALVLLSACASTSKVSGLPDRQECFYDSTGALDCSRVPGGAAGEPSFWRKIRDAL